MSVVSLRAPVAVPSELGSLHARVLRRTSADGHTPTPLHNVCIYRFSSPSTFAKAPTYGVTLGVVLSGSKEVRVAGRSLFVDAHRMLVITRETELEAAVIGASHEEPYLGLSIGFSPEAVARALVILAEAGGATSTEESVPAFVTEVDPRVVRALERVVEALDDDLEREVLVPLAVEEILFRLLRSDSAAAVRSAVGGADAPRILEAMRFIRAESHRALRVQELARHVAMSPSHFAHRFRAVARVSPMRYVREVRLDRARTLLLEPGARASEVASRVGFESPSHFTREFKRRFGVSPSHYLGRPSS